MPVELSAVAVLKRAEVVNVPFDHVEDARPAGHRANLIVLRRAIDGRDGQDRARRPRRRN